MTTKTSRVPPLRARPTNALVISGGAKSCDMVKGGPASPVYAPLASWTIYVVVESCVMRRPRRIQRTTTIAPVWNVDDWGSSWRDYAAVRGSLLVSPIRHGPCDRKLRLDPHGG